MILAPGARTYDPTQMQRVYLYGKHPNVITALEFERILSASGPFLGHMVRPSDKAEPKKIAWLQCVGSRNTNNCKNGYCSAVCCMYAIKEAVVAKEHSKEPLETTIFFMDMRTYGKDFEKFCDRAKREYGVRFVRSRVHTIDPVRNRQPPNKSPTRAGSSGRKPSTWWCCPWAWKPHRTPSGWP